MKKLLAVATIGVVGYLVVKKIKERKNNDVVEVNEEMENEEVVENVEEEIVIDNDDEEAIEVENVEIVNEEKEEVKLVDIIKRIVKAPIKIVIKVCGFACKILTKINKNIEHKANKEIDYYKNDYVLKDGVINKLLDIFDDIRINIEIVIVIVNRYLILGLVMICNILNKII